MKRLLWVLCSCCLSLPLFAERGIVVSVCEAYKAMFIPSLAHLRFNLECDLPIEVWHSGDELSEETKETILKFSKVSLRDIAKELNVEPHVYRGWHIKPWLLKLTAFDEVILMDADLFFYDNPEKLFSDPGYIETGAFFFRDRTAYTFPLLGCHGFPMEDSRYSQEKYLGRREFIRKLVPVPSEYVPLEWRHYWGEELPTRKNIFLSEHQESGCIALDKKRHVKGLENAIALNEDRQVTYSYVYGDKETYWLGFEMAQEPYTMNPEPAYGLKEKWSPFGSKQYIYMVQCLNGTLFYQQKDPVPITTRAQLFDKYSNFKRNVTKEEVEKMLLVLEMKELFWN